jgi:glycosyltransferase involved in cell wall biosynthesis
LNSAETLGLSIIIPTYQAAGHIRQFIQGLINLLPFEQIEIICVDDASTDATWSELNQLKVKEPRIKSFRLKTNVGQHRAILYGISQARLEYTLTLDDDMLHQLDEVLHFVRSAIAMDSDLVYGRFIRKYEARWRATASNSLTLLLKKYSPLIEGASQVRLINRKVRIQLSQQPINRFVFIDCVLPRLTSDIRFIDFDYSSNSVSRYSFKRLSSMTFQIFLHYTNFPNAIPLLLGSILVCVGLWIPYYPLCMGLVTIVFAKDIVHKMRRISNGKLRTLELME